MYNPISFSWKKEYIYFEDGHFNSKSLNIFQRFFRVIGFYKNTRLAVVREVAYQACFEPNPILSTLEKERVIKVIQKSPRFPDFFLGAETLKTGDIVRYQGNIHISKDEASYSFTIKIIKDNKSSRESYIELIKNTNKSFDVKSLRELGANNEKKSWDRNDLLTLVTYLFLAKIVNDSERLSELDVPKDFRERKIEKNEAKMEHSILSRPVAVDLLLQDENP